MRNPIDRHRATATATGTTILLAVMVCGFGRGNAERIEQINTEWERGRFEGISNRRKAKTPAEREQIQKKLAANDARMVKNCLDIASRQPNGADGLIALKLVACRVPTTPEGKKAAETLIKNSSTADLTILARALRFPTNVPDAPIYPVVPILLMRVKERLDHPEAARILASIVCGSVDPNTETPPAEFSDAADLIVKHFPESPDITNFCEVVDHLSTSHSWTGRYEKHLRTILERNRHRDVQAAAAYALASVVAVADDRREEAEKLYEAAIKRFDGSYDYHYADIEKDLNARAEIILTELRSIGKLAPEIDGVDLQGHDMKLSEFRGKVVLISFWATWCAPCMKLIPHERDLATRLAGKPFVLIGVNGDEDVEPANAAVASNRMTWRSFQNANGRRTISSDWHVRSWPTFYLIDQKGIIKNRWVDGQMDEMNRAIGQLLAGVIDQNKAP